MGGTGGSATHACQIHAGEGAYALGQLIWQLLLQGTYPRTEAESKSECSISAKEMAFAPAYVDQNGLKQYGEAFANTGRRKAAATGYQIRGVCANGLFRRLFRGCFGLFMAQWAKGHLVAHGFVQHRVAKEGPWSPRTPGHMGPEHVKPAFSQSPEPGAIRKTY